MPSPLTGIHHVTAFAKSPKENHDFYTRVLGQRMVKKTVNFDDPLTYHLYFGEERGTPGTLLTHFPHPNAKPGVHGSPEIIETTLAIPQGSLEYWNNRLKAAGAKPKQTTDLGTDRIEFEDPHTMRFALVETAQTGGYAPAGVDPVHAITGVEAMRIALPNLAETIEFLTNTLGFTTRTTESNRARLDLNLGEAAPAQTLDLIETPAYPRTRMGAGTVHHVAWRVPDEATQREVSDRVRAAGTAVTPILDRQYFRSIYFRIPAGVVFEVATDGPGFDVDEPTESLGEALKLPPQYEPRRAEIESHLVPLD